VYTGTQNDNTHKGIDTQIQSYTDLDRDTGTDTEIPSSVNTAT